jgi:hypothetical protein
MSGMMVLIMAFILALGAVPGWSQIKDEAKEKANLPVAEEKALQMSHEMVPKRQEMLKEMYQMLGQEEITPDQKKKMQEMIGTIQFMMKRMQSRMPMCPMLQKVEDQRKKIRALEDRLDKLERAKGRSR